MTLKTSTAVPDFVRVDLKHATIATASSRADLSEAKERCNHEIEAVARTARECFSSNLLRLPAAHKKYGVARSTFLKKVRLHEAPQRVYIDTRIVAWREIDLEMMQAAQTIASRNGFMLDSKTFVSALSAPVNAATGVKHDH